MRSSKEEQTCTEVQEASPVGLVDKAMDLAIDNQQAGLFLAWASGIAIVISTIADSAAKLIRAVRE